MFHFVSPFSMTTKGLHDGCQGGAKQWRTFTGKRFGVFGPPFISVRGLRRILRGQGVFLVRSGPGRIIAKNKDQKRPIGLGIAKKGSSALPAIDNGCRCNF
jgi:hypothetical protein